MISVAKGEGVLLMVDYLNGRRKKRL